MYIEKIKYVFFFTFEAFIPVVGDIQKKIRNFRKYHNRCTKVNSFATFVEFNHQRSAANALINILRE